MNGLRISAVSRMRPLFGLSLFAAALVAALALDGLLFQDAVYPSEALRRSFVPNDLVNLIVGLPVLLGSLALAWRGRLAGLLFWPGALLFIAYNAIAYAAGLPFGPQTVLYAALAVLSLFSLSRLLASLDAAQIRQRLQGAVPARFAGGVLIVFGALFFLRQAASLGSLSGPELGTALADLLVCPAWVIGGILLWRKQALGYALGTGLLFQSSMLFVGLLAFFALQPLLVAAPFRMADFVVILVMGLVCFVPFGLLVRGVARVE
ncbi:MAG TPA: hypothetical protein VMT46_11335 [Anaerolineaceae bacterium]|nr:hypothetical protein [Anaerolineaceae bacterium]